MSLKPFHFWLIPPLLMVLVAGVFYARNLADKWQLQALNASVSPTSMPGIYDPQMVADLPEVAQRYFDFSLQPGTVLHQNLRLKMEGQLGLGDKVQPNYFPFTAKQIIAPDRGFSWDLASKGLPMVISGSDLLWDDQSWTRFWLYGVVPVARMGDDLDHFRSAEGRLLVEMAAWSPAALLPQNGVEWVQQGPNTARAWVTTSTGRHGVDVHLEATGQPKAYVIDRWSNANADSTYQFQPFGGTPKRFVTVDGITIAQQVDVGNHFGTSDYFPFFRANLTDIEFF